uniref:glutathione transferase n=1 Tax=Lutzomyia longipalpis TaxID=7200 RepID=A0A1B0CHI4_LUTLO
MLVGQNEGQSCGVVADIERCHRRRYKNGSNFFDYPRTPIGLKKLNISLATFETYLKRSGTKYAAADHLTIADFPLVTATLCLEAIGFSLDEYPLVKAWYGNFKQQHPDLWAIGEAGMKEITEFEKNPPDLSGMNHPIHPIRKKN